MYVKIEDNLKEFIKQKIFLKKLRCNDKDTNTIRIQLKNEEEIFSDKSEDFHLTYVLKTEDYLG